MPIGVFDSGVGGLTVFRALEKALPQRPLVYLYINQITVGFLIIECKMFDACGHLILLNAFYVGYRQF